MYVSSNELIINETQPCLLLIKLPNSEKHASTHRV